MRSILRVNVTDLTCGLHDATNEYQRLGGRGLTSTLVAREVKEICHPLGPKNKLVVAPGILAGTTAPCCQRVSVGAKSPLTYGIKEANSGGPAGQKLGRLGLAAIVLEGKAELGHLYLLHISREGARIEEANDLKSCGNYETVNKLLDRYGKKTVLSRLGKLGKC